ncbi:MAG TPA: hypothetical protein VNY73_10945, partial [Bacteroidia bacterium]|nr:hypothetical protein [Bacteroidia bacterium]
MQQKLKLVLFVLLFILLWLPFLQQQTNFFAEPKLKGAFVKPTMPVFSFDSLNTLLFQKKFEDFENSDFGFRGFFVKMRNSFDNVMFNDLSVVDNISGKDGLIFSKGSIERTLGIQYNGKEQNESTIDKIKFLKEDIEKKGGHFLAIMAPSKEKTFQDCLPQEYIGKDNPKNNYMDFIEGYKNANIPYIDFCPFYSKMRDTCRYPVFTKTGFHWSVYGSSYVQDSLVSYVQHSLGKPFPQYKRTGTEISDTAYDSDADFEYSLNLFYGIGEKKYHYPKFELISSTKKNYRPKVIVIGDSFFWQLKNHKMLANVFSDESRFWFYFSLYAYPLNDDAGIALPKDESVIDELQSADYVILFSNIGTLNLFPYEVADFYCKNISKPGVVQSIYDYIRTSSVWKEKSLNDGNPDVNSKEQFFRAEAKQIYRNKKLVHIKGSADKFLCAGGSDEYYITANRDNASSWETFSLLDLGNDVVAFFSYKNKFLSADLGKENELVNDRSKISDWESFIMIKLGN